MENSYPIGLEFTVAESPCFEPHTINLPASPPAVERPERRVAALGCSELGDERLLLAGVGSDPLPYASSK